MLVRQSTYDSMTGKAVAYKQAFDALQHKWNVLVRRINAKGGEDFLIHGTMPDKTIRQQDQSGQFTPEEMRKILQAMHPDRNPGSELAVTITRKINAMRG